MGAMVDESELWRRVHGALAAAEADGVVEGLDAALRQHPGVRSCDVLLADLRMTVLEPVLGHETGRLAVAGTAAGRCWGEQVAVTERSAATQVVHVPLTVRGERMGVLRGVLDDDGSEGVVAVLSALAPLIGEHILVAGEVTDRYRRACRPQRLTLAAEMQWQLLPRRSVQAGAYRLAGQLEPAFAVRGDNFDWSQNGDVLTVTVTNGMGESVTAATLTTLAITAVRNARRAGLDLVDQAVLANEAVWAYHGGDQHVATLLLEVHLPSGRTRVVDAGSPQLWRVRVNHAEQIAFEPQLPLGMVEDTDYRAEELTLDDWLRLAQVPASGA